MKKRRYKEKEREKERTNCSSKVESTKPTKSKKWEEYVPINTVRVKKNFFFKILSHFYRLLSWVAHPIYQAMSDPTMNLIRRKLLIVYQNLLWASLYT